VKVQHIKKAVVTGAQGFIGRALVNYLWMMGTDVISIDIKPGVASGYPSVVLDLKRSGSLDGFLDADTVVFHLAAQADVAGSVQDPRKDFEENLGGFFEVLESVRRANCQLIFPSSGSIFDPSNALPLSERALVKPTSPYSAAKAAGEAYCVAYHRSYGLNTKIARMFSVYGEGMDRFAIHDLVRKVQNNSRELVILGDGQQIRDYLYIGDAVRGLITIARAGIPGEDYNLASGVPVRLLDLAQEIVALMGYPNINIIPRGQSFPGDVPRWYAKIDKIEQIGFKPEVPMEEGLQRTIAWLTGGMVAGKAEGLA
jgi:UDP-glucose 4-epimerase